jgi:transposase
MSSKVLYVGMDVDNQKIVLAKLPSGGSSASVEERVIANTPSALSKYFTPLVKQTDVLATYEAGCFGFSLYHRLTDLGVAALVAAPGLIPRKPSDRQKTDRRDARTLAFCLRAGQLTGVHVPTKQDESVRDYLRMYEDQREDLRRCKQRILHFLMRRALRYAGGGPWTVKHMNWLATVELEGPLDRQTLDYYLSRHQELQNTCAQLSQEIETIAQHEPYRVPVSILRAFKGIKTLIALSFITEIGDFRRFSSAAQFMAFLGLVPSEHSSGCKRRLGGITKAGNSHLRRLLVEAAWHYRSYHPSSRLLTERRRGVDPHIISYLNRAGRHLNHKYLHLLLRGKRSQVAVTAVARELCGFIWGAMVGKVA